MGTDTKLIKFQMLIELIREVDGRRITSPLSDYDTVMDLMNRYKRTNKLSQPQLYLLEEIHKQYRRKKLKKSK